MFLSDKLEEIQARDIEILEKGKAFCAALAESLLSENNKDMVRYTALAATIKRIDRTWRTFAAKYGYKDDFAHTVINNAIKEYPELRDELGWEAI